MNTILILGAYSDIAEAIARKFASANYNLILAGRTVKELHRLQQDLSIRYTVNIKIYEFDALDYSSHQDFYSNLGIFPNITICAFGYLGDQTIGEREWGEAQRILLTNYFGAVSILNIVANDYEDKGTGCIIGISSVAGERGRKSNYLYGSAKGGLSIYLDGLRNRLAKKGAHVISVKPGFVATKMTEDLDLPKLLTAKPTHVSDAIYKGYIKKRNTIYVLPIWRFIMIVIKLIPESLFKKLDL